ncbi:solute carrier family 35 member G1-like isoform X2 [Coregonus clupeaformis]|uniref:solute carrier family 35 member G1-like isoform X2 n=1 Tax=Coregonus clupeaformis TaxID=59861 RepID=UPI001BE034C5|nr:solute carrier family 35 member G1-like isoform X2 [Coregonus clupeaformis]
MGDLKDSIDDRVLSAVPRREEDVKVVFHKVGDNDDDEDTTERINLQSNSHDELGNEEARTRTVESSAKQRLCPPSCCRIGGGGDPISTDAGDTVAKALLVKTIDGVHAVEISAIRCFFQMLFVMPMLIYYKTGFLGPRDKRIYLVMRGFLGSNAMILLFYAVQQMPLADATVIMFSNPVFTALLAWIFLKEKCTIWDCIFTVFTLAGVIMIARPPFIFGARIEGIEGDYTNHLKGTIAAFGGAIGAACTFVILRKMGKSVHYYMSVWYYAVIGLIECVITLFILGEWTIPFCGRDRWILMLIAILGIAGQTFLTKALQIEKAGPVALTRTIDVVLAFIFQFFFFNRKPTMWSLGGACCVVVSTCGVALRKWYSNTHPRKSREPRIRQIFFSRNK